MSNTPQTDALSIEHEQRFDGEFNYRETSRDYALLARQLESHRNELLEVLQAWLNFAEGWPSNPNPMERGEQIKSFARVAIAKAQGSVQSGPPQSQPPNET